MSQRSAAMTEVYRFEHAFTPEGWRGPLWVEIDDSGWIVAVHPASRSTPVQSRFRARYCPVYRTFIRMRFSAHFRHFPI